jgi:hypothetical protein
MLAALLIGDPLDGPDSTSRTAAPMPAGFTPLRYSRLFAANPTCPVATGQLTPTLQS